MTTKYGGYTAAELREALTLALEACEDGDPFSAAQVLRTLLTTAPQKVAESVQDVAVPDTRSAFEGFCEAHEWPTDGEGGEPIWLAFKAGVRFGLATAPQAPVADAAWAESAWRCFHCDEIFTDAVAAREHFGSSLAQAPACQIDVAEYRAMEELVRRCNEEDSDLHREIHRLHAQHHVEQQREEEKGYARGLQDQKAETLRWAVRRWEAEVSLRPLINVNRRALDDTWRQIVRYCDGDAAALLGPKHGELITHQSARASEAGEVVAWMDINGRVVAMPWEIDSGAFSPHISDGWIGKCTIPLTRMVELSDDQIEEIISRVADEWNANTRNQWHELDRKDRDLVISRAVINASRGKG